MSTRLERLTKPQLRELLLESGVEIPTGRVLKSQMIDLLKEHKRMQQSEYSSEDDDSVIESDHEEKPASASLKKVTVDLERLKDDEISRMLTDRGVKVGPIMSSTRALYVKKLQNLVKNEEADVSSNGNGAHNDSKMIVADITAVDDDGGEYSDVDVEEVDGEESADVTAHLTNGHNNSMISSIATQKKVVVSSSVVEQVEEEISSSQVVMAASTQVLTHRKFADADDDEASVDDVVDSVPKQEAVAAKAVTRRPGCGHILLRTFFFFLTLALFAILVMAVQILMKKHKIKLIE